MSDETLPPSQAPAPATGSGEPPSRPEREEVLEPIRQRLATSTALLLQESGERLRKQAELSTAASGVALRMMLTGRDPERASMALRQAQEALSQATAHYQRLGELSASLLSQLQPPAGEPSGAAGWVESREPDAQLVVGELDALADVAVRKP
ncbi:hypothetical protein ATI61_10444 [Archangium gephyra]|uniref:Uncharacterized protein n=1 Tax=Archangium gephyra TaxID=48 RepID=A0ABX9K3T8_9BACT|nr:hypothetical protein [Archangium gephyra]REG32757.1 hypothetical protein ATI61_10444 [Archangium gephyra]